MRHLKHCLNPKVIAVVVAIGIGVYVLVPGAFASALPFLVLAVCPLSMVVMMAMMGGSGERSVPQAGQEPGAEDASGLQARVAQLEQQLAARSDVQPPAGDGRATTT